MITHLKSMTLVSYTSNERAEILDGTNWAKDFSWPQICQISKHMHAYKARKGNVLFEEGEIDQSMCLIVKGQVNIVKAGNTHGATTIATVNAPHSFGEMSLIDGEPRSAQVVAATDVLILSITKDSFFKLVEQAPPLALQLLWKISKLISQRLRKVSGQLVERLDNGN
jgi:CRP-like cAMP-binding protein